MANYAATDSVTITDTVEGAVAALETALETINNGKTIQACDIIRIEANKYAAYVVYTDAVA